MLHVARECTGRPPAPSSPAPPQHTLLTFGEFCLFSSDLQRGYQHHTAVPPQPHKQTPVLVRQCSDRGRQDCTRPDKKTKCSAPCQVFLGGSCNPTSWRQDVAIPTLRALGISFYNPQVTHWEEALVEREHQAKSTASVLFFVFDRRTRNVASMVEVAYMAACPRKIMLVLDTYPGPGHLIGGEPMSEREYEELSGGLNTVQDLVERKGIPVFSQLPNALHCTAKILREDLWPQQLGVADNVTPIKYPHLQIGDKYSKIQTAFEHQSSLPLSEAQHVFRAAVGRDLTHDELLTIIAAKKDVSGGSISACTELPLKEISVTLDELCCIVAEFSSPRVEQRRPRDLLTNSVASSLQKALGWATPRRSPRHLPSDISTKSSPPYSNYSSDCPTTNGGHTTLPYDVYLGGPSAFSDNWRQAVALPLLSKYGLKYCIPASSKHTPKCDHAKNDNSTEQLQETTLGNCIDSVSRNSICRRANNCDETINNSISGPDRGECDCVHPSVCCGRRAQRTNNKTAPSPVSNPVSLASDINGRLYPSEASYIDQCRVLLFVITSNTRCVSAMTLASHYIGLGANVVLCVQKIPDNAIVDGEEMSKAAIKDYNRGRSYLTDQATKDGVPVFTDIAEAVECVRQKCSSR